MTAGMPTNNWESDHVMTLQFLKQVEGSITKNKSLWSADERCHPQAAMSISHMFKKTVEYNSTIKHLCICQPIIKIYQIFKKIKPNST